MPQEILQDFIGKECIITILMRKKMKGKITKVEGFWVEVEDEKSRRVINGSTIRDIITYEK